jgi:hypothetical protein
VNIANTSLYKEYIALREEVLKHKWYESERAGRDVGFNAALIDWTMRFKAAWLKARKCVPTPTPVC